MTRITTGVAQTYILSLLVTSLVTTEVYMTAAGKQWSGTQPMRLRFLILRAQPLYLELKANSLAKMPPVRIPEFPMPSQQNRATIVKQRGRILPGCGWTHNYCASFTLRIHSGQRDSVEGTYNASCLRELPD